MKKVNTISFIRNKQSSLWITTMQEEVEALHKNQTWKLVLLPPGRKKKWKQVGLLDQT